MPTTDATPEAETPTVARNRRSSSSTEPTNRAAGRAPAEARGAAEARSIWELAVAAVLTGDQRELDAKLNRVAARRARPICSRLAHRGAPCDCPVAAHVDTKGTTFAASAIASAHSQIFKKWTTDGTGDRVAGIRLWLQRGAIDDFLTFDGKVLVHGRDTDVRRAWNTERNLKANADATSRLAGEDLAAMAEAMVRLGVSDADWALLELRLRDKTYKDRPAELRPIQDPRLWLEALYDDATQTAPALIDAERVLRWLQWTARASKSDRTNPNRRGTSAAADEATVVGTRAAQVAIVQRVGRAFDDALALACPGLYDLLLDRARQQTRPASLWGRESLESMRRNW